MTHCCHGMWNLVSHWGENTLKSAGEELSGNGEVKCIEMHTFKYMKDLNQHTFSSTGKMIKWR
jgi:hypothetical protein